MSKYLIPLLGLILLLAVVAQAQPPVPPAHGSYAAGWGMNPTKWTKATGSFNAWGLYDPLGGGGGAGWIVGGWGSTPVYIDYAPITMELWVEMYSLQTYHYTSYQWHRLGNEAEHICFYIEGLIQSNNGQWIILTRDTDALTHLYFRGDMFGRTGAPYGYDIPITWRARYGNGSTYGSNIVQGWQTVTPDPDDIKLQIEACDHWFQFEGCFDLEYHIEDGYYSLEMAGCPAPLL